MNTVAIATYVLGCYNKIKNIIYLTSAESSSSNHDMNLFYSDCGSLGNGLNLINFLGFFTSVSAYGDFNTAAFLVRLLGGITGCCS